MGGSVSNSAYILLPLHGILQMYNMVTCWCRQTGINI